MNSLLIGHRIAWLLVGLAALTSNWSTAASGNLGDVPPGERPPVKTVLCLYERGGLQQNAFHTQFLTLARFPAEWVYCGDQTKLAPAVAIGMQRVPMGSLPAGLVVRRELGLVTVPCLDGQVVHRAPRPSIMVYETRATKTPGGDYLLMFPEGRHYGGQKTKTNTMLAYRSADKGKTWTGPTMPFDIDYNQHGFIPFIPRGRGTCAAGRRRARPF